jgi:hypothetical protein
MRGGAGFWREVALRLFFLVGQEQAMNNGKVEKIMLPRYFRVRERGTGFILP